MRVELPAGADEVSYLRGVKIKDVKLKGVRNRPVMRAMGRDRADEPVHARRAQQVRDRVSVSRYLRVASGAHSLDPDNRQTAISELKAISFED